MGIIIRNHFPIFNWLFIRTGRLFTRLLGFLSASFSLFMPFNFITFLTLENAASGVTTPSEKLTTSGVLMSGFFEWLPLQIKLPWSKRKSHCNINVRDFPYDEQICAMYLTSMVYSSSEGFSKWCSLEGALVRPDEGYWAPISNG